MEFAQLLGSSITCLFVNIVQDEGYFFKATDRGKVVSQNLSWVLHPVNNRV